MLQECLEFLVHYGGKTWGHRRLFVQIVIKIEKMESSDILSC